MMRPHHARIRPSSARSAPQLTSVVGLALSLALCLALALGPTAPATGQTSPVPASLVADAVRVESDSRLIAEGQVEVLYRGARLTARRITYDRGSERLDIAGPITLTDDQGTVILADSAALDADLRNGILNSARLVLDRQLQLAATEIARADDRYTQLSNVVASSCEVCAQNPTPTWEIRAARVIHDEVEGQIYFDDATFRLFGLPVAYFPRLRLPDPDNTRATGFLIPSIRNTSQLGTGFKAPFFWAIAPSADLTLTPYLSPGTTTLEARYRQALTFGDLALRGAYSRDDIREDSRWYLFGEARFRLPRDFRLELDIENVSDNSYFNDYDYSGQDRLKTELRLVRADRGELFFAALSSYETLRPGEIGIRDELPGTAGLLTYERRLFRPWGELRWGIDVDTLRRDSDRDAVGRDVTSLGGSLDALTRRVLPTGLVLSNRARVEIDAYRTFRDAAFDSDATRVVPSLETEFRLPLDRAGAAGARELLEPVVQIAWSDAYGDAVPNEDSLLLEFDEGNLFALSRFPGDDAVETGLRAALGVGYTRISADGWTLGVTAGRILRGGSDTEIPDDGVEIRSNWLAATRLQLGDRVDLTARAVLDKDLMLTRNAAGIGYLGRRISLDGNYVWLDAEPAENRFEDTREVTLDADLRLSRHWIGSFEGRYDFSDDRAAEAGVGLEYRTECIAVELSAERSYSETAEIGSDTSFGLSVSLAGFGSDRNDSTYRKTCNG